MTTATAQTVDLLIQTDSEYAVYDAQLINPMTGAVTLLTYDDAEFLYWLLDQGIIDLTQMTFFRNSEGGLEKLEAKLEAMGICPRQVFVRAEGGAVIYPAEPFEVESVPALGDGMMVALHHCFRIKVEAYGAGDQATAASASLSPLQSAA